MLTFGIDYDPAVWIPLPPLDVLDDDQARALWVAETIAATTIAPPWNDEPYRSDLTDVLELQLQSRDREAGVSLWFAPQGLPASAYLEISVEPREHSAADEAQALVATAPSVIESPAQRVSSARLGEGWATARIVPLSDGSDRVSPADEGETMSELLYAFAPDGALVSIVARSADERAIGLLSATMWDVIESVTIA